MLYSTHCVNKRYICTYYAAWRNVGSFHGEGDTVEGDEHEDGVVKPVVGCQVLAPQPQPRHQHDSLLGQAFSRPTLYIFLMSVTLEKAR